LRFVCRHVNLRVENAETPFTARYRPGEILSIPVAHGEGRYTCDEATHERLVNEKRIVFRYVDADGQATPEGNPNGSRDNIAGIVGGPNNNVLGMMPHPERAASVHLGSADGQPLLVSLRDALARTRGN